MHYFVWNNFEHALVFSEQVLLKRMIIQINNMNDDTIKNSYIVNKFYHFAFATSALVATPTGM